MSICASGASRAKSTSAASIVVDAAFVQSLLPPGLAWLYPYLPYMHGLEIGNVATFCTADPPTWTVPSAADIFNFLAGGPISQYQLVDKFIQDVTKAYLWYQLCECTSGATPAAPAAPSAPANLPAVNPPGVVNFPIITPCASSVWTVVQACAGNNFTNVAPIIFGGRNVTSARLTLVNTIFSGAGYMGTMQAVWFDNAGGVLRSESKTIITPGTTVLITGAAPIGAVKLDGRTVGSGAGDCGNLSFTTEVFCNGDVPGGTQTPCCPPDPVLMARVNQILDLVTLVQRQSVPFGYVPGTVHAGLTGSGSFSVSGLIGCKVDLTTIPASYGVDFGAPDEHFGLGFVTFGSPDGYPSSKRLDHQPTLLLPARCGAYTTLAYDLSPGVVATITELAREA